jgi:hypothetical protein
MRLVAALALAVAALLACRSDEAEEPEPSEAASPGAVGASAESPAPEAAAMSTDPYTTEPMGTDLSTTEPMGTDMGGDAASSTDSPSGVAETGLTVYGQWVELGVGDCSGRDTGSMDAVAFPPAEACTPERYGTIAVCWDGTQFHNLGDPSRTWCTFKSVSADNCSGGSSPGRVFECRAR